MADLDTYAEALRALATVDARQNDALRNADQHADGAEAQARASQTDQQRMFHRAAADLTAAATSLDRLRQLLGAPPPPPHAGGAAGDAPPLREIRATLGLATDWVAENEPLVRSLLRSRRRLVAAARRPAPAPAVATTPVPNAPARSQRKLVAIVAVCAIIAITAIVIFVIATRG